MVKHKVWIIENNYKLVIEELQIFKSYIEMAKKKRKDMDATFYLPRDEEVKVVREPPKRYPS
jgi:hypothetical protein